MTVVVLTIIVCAVLSAESWPGCTLNQLSQRLVAIALTMKSKRTWKKRPKFNPSRLPKFRSEEAAWESVNSHKQHYHDSLHKPEHILSEVTVARIQN